MKGGTVQILWHGKDPILSVDFHPPSGLLATAGADRDIKLWSLHREEKSKENPSATFKANLSYHSAAVNVLRFSPSGDLLASGGDGGEVVIWRLVQVGEEAASWKVWKTLRFHLKDVLDLGWSPDGSFLVSGSVDNTCIIWDVMKGCVEQVLSDHQHYVQGVSWDPVGKYVASLSGDRTCRIYSLRALPKRSKGKEKKEKNVNEIKKRTYSCQHVLCKKDVSTPITKLEEDIQKQVSSMKQYLFHDENMPSFFRRLAWSPDGSFLLLPSGFEKLSSDAAPTSVSYVVTRNNLSRPILQLPAGRKPVVGVRFCPILFGLKSNRSWKHDTTIPDHGALQLPYRMVFAVATLNSVFIYDTQQSCPIAIFAGLHYAPITDLAWSPDAKYLAVSSQDGYCTLVGFDEGELGVPIPSGGHMSGQDGLTQARPAETTLEAPLPTVLAGEWTRTSAHSKNSGGLDSSTGEDQKVRVQGPGTPASHASNNGAFLMLSCSQPAIENKPEIEPLREQNSAVESAEGPTTPSPHDTMPDLTPPSFQKSQDEFAHIHVRPLKFRRITPKAISEEVDVPVNLKSVKC